MAQPLKKSFIRFKNTLTDPIKLKHFVQSNKRELLLWGFFCALIIIIYISLSDGNFSFFLTLSGAVQMFGFLLICWKINTTQSASGISLHTILCYIFSFGFRISAILTNIGYIPEDKTGDWLYQGVECFSFLLSIITLIFIQFYYKSTYNSDLDKIKCYYLIPPTLILAVLFHPSLNQVWLADVAWTFALYLEAVAMLPQLYIFTKKGGEIESFTSHYVASQGVSRIIAFVFWIFTIDEINTVIPLHFVLVKYILYFYFKQAPLIFWVYRVCCLNNSDLFAWRFLISLCIEVNIYISSGIPMTLPSYIV